MLKGIKNWIRIRLIIILENHDFKENINIKSTLQKRATQSTCVFIENNFNTAILDFADRSYLIDYCLLNLKVKNGLIAEFGVAQGKQIDYIASKTKELVYGFDSFDGLPEDWRTGYYKGRFKGDKFEEKENIKIVEGLFAKSIPIFLENNKKKMSFIHIDSDLYSSAKTVLTNLDKFIVKGTIILFDEYFNFPGWEKHEFKAFNEYIEEFKREFMYLGYTNNGAQVAILML